MSYTSNVMTMIQLSKQNILCCVGCASVELSGIATEFCAAMDKCTKPMNYKTCCHCWLFGEIQKYQWILSILQHADTKMDNNTTTAMKQHIKTPQTDLTVPHWCKLKLFRNAISCSCQSNIARGLFLKIKCIWKAWHGLLLDLPHVMNDGNQYHSGVTMYFSILIFIFQTIICL